MIKDLSTSILKIRTEHRKTTMAPGTMLVAEPFLSESYFNHGVITLVDYTADDGALGLVMNNPSGHTLDEFLDGVDKSVKVPVFCGGPIGTDRIVFMHTLGDKVFEGAKEFAPGLFLGGDFEAALDYVNSGYEIEGMIRFFVGYSGWDSPQLAEELKQEVWAVAESPLNRTLMLESFGDHYWHRFVRMMGDTYRAWRFFSRHTSAN